MDWSDSSITTVIAAIVVIASSVWMWHRSTATATQDDIIKSAAPSNGAAPSGSATPGLKNVWDAGASSKSKALKKGHDGKPFGSKYYYAHNNPNTTGGYKDGLRMEDYTMNGPRLLSKGGEKLDDDVVIQHSIHDGQQQQEENGPAHMKPSTDAAVASSPAADRRKSRSSNGSNDGTSAKKITKYLWDDPGDWKKAVGTIRIDTLPPELDFADVTVEDVNATLIPTTNGLEVQLRTKSHGNYYLRIQELYGKVDSVTTVVKSKRLLIKLKKNKKAVLALKNQSNLEAWPHPHKTILKAAVY